MNEAVELDQFELLEEKVSLLILLIEDLRNEKTILSDKLQSQEKKMDELSEQVKVLKENRENAKNRMVSLLEKIEEVKL